MSNWLIEALKAVFPPQPGGAVGAGFSVPVSTTFGSPVPQPPVGVRESRDLAAHGHPALVRRFGDFKLEYESMTGHQLFITCVWRSKDLQFEYFQVGRVLQNGVWVVVNKQLIKTNIDGVTKKGRHNVFPSEAVDVAIDLDPGPGKHLSWDSAAYDPFAVIAPKHGLVWGGDWNGNGRSDDERFVDRPHLELPAGVIA